MTIKQLVFPFKDNTKSRAHCPECGLLVALTDKGFYAKHKKPAAWFEDRVQCPKSQKKLIF